MPSLEFIVVLVLILFNGLLAMSELAVASSRPARLKALADEGVRGARRALALSSDPGRFLSTVQIGITLIGIVAGAVSGAALGARVSGWFEGWGVPEQFAEPAGFIAVVGVITYLSLVAGELVPKQIALGNPERIACLVAPAMMRLAQASAPLVYLLDRSGRILLRLIGQTGRRTSDVSDAEIHAMIAEAETSGVLEPAERKMISGVMRLADRQVRTMMTPRGDVTAIDVEAPASKIARLIARSGHSRFVAYRGNPDNIIGILQSRDIAVAALGRREIRIASLVREAPAVQDTLDALDAVGRLRNADIDMGLVYDEYGHFEGIVTTADILEAIVGAFRHAGEAPEPDIVERRDGSLLVSGKAPVDLMSERLGLRLPRRRGYQTVAGFVLDRLGRLPEVGERFEERGFNFEIVDLDGRRIDRVIVKKKRPPARRAAT